MLQLTCCLANGQKCLVGATARPGVGGYADWLRNDTRVLDEIGPELKPAGPVASNQESYFRTASAGEQIEARTMGALSLRRAFITC
jgi:hypothetical protein